MIRVAIIAIVGTLSFVNIRAAESANAPDFSNDVAPILAKYCSGCHNATDAESDFSLATFAELQKYDCGALKNPALKELGLAKPLEAVKNTRKIGKKDMVHNNLQPKIDVDPETYEVRADGELLVCEPAKVLPMAQRYFLF